MLCEASPLVAARERIKATFFFQAPHIIDRTGAISSRGPTRVALTLPEGRVPCSPSESCTVKSAELNAVECPSAWPVEWDSCQHIVTV